MDMESETSALESVEDNGLIGEDKLVSVSTTVEDDTTIDLNKQSNSQVETSPSISKGFGLRKWKRLKRRDHVKDSSLNMENSKILKRVLSDPHAKQMHVRSLEVNQSSLGSVNDMVGFAIAGTSHGTSLACSAGVDSDNSEDRSSKSSTAASGHSLEKQRSKYLGGKSVVSSGYDSFQRKNTSVEKSKKLRGERIKIEKENSRSSMESPDSKSSNFVFMQGASFSSSSRDQKGRRMMDYNDAHTSNQEDKVGEEEEEEETEDYSQGDSQIRNSGSNSSGNLDPLIEAFRSFQNLQEALKRELQEFQELGKETISLLHDDEAESSSCIHVGHGQASEGSPSHRFGSEYLGLTSLDSEMLNLMENVEQLEFKLEEAKCIREVKESQIRELESTIRVPEPYNRGTEIKFEDIFQQKMEAEIEHLIFSRSVANLKRRIKLIEEEKTLAENEAHKMLSKFGEAETKAKNLKNEVQDIQNHCVEMTEIQEMKSFRKRAIKTTSCILLQLGLLFMIFNFQLLPESETVVPT